MSILETIFATKRQEVAAAQSALPLSELRARANDRPPTRGFLHALLRAGNAGLIAEVKKASPSKGLIRADFDAVEIAKIYETAGATCLSILTDQPYFQGAPEFLTNARNAVSLPALRKDFIFDPYQVFEARAWDADAILLIAASLSDDQLVQLSDTAKELGLDVLVEVHTEEEAARALSLAFPLIGVNNRDLSSFKTGLEVSERLIPMIASQAFPVSESAIETHEDVLRVRAAGARAVLIGTTFTAATDIGAKVLEAMG
jgi:indole-3-glycerol phosphate synthase